MSEIRNNQPVVFINQSSGYLMVDIVNAFSEAGNKCVLISGLLVERNKTLNNNVKKHKIIRYNNTTAFKRIFTWIMGVIQILFIILLKYNKAYLFIVSNPPLAPILPLIFRNRFSLLIFDVYPDALTEFGILGNRSPIIKFWRKANQKVFSRSENIFTITDGMKKLLEFYTDEKNITVVSLWSDNEFLKRIPENENPFMVQHGLIGKFVVLYSGNIGLSNDVEVMVDVAKNIDRDNIIFVIIGNGARKKDLEERVIKERISNLLVLPWQDVSMLSYTLSSAKLSVVALGKRASRLAIPSKIYSLLSVGMPLLGITGQDSDLRYFIESNEIGRCFLPEDYKKITEFILHLVDNPELCKNMAEKALKLSEKYTSRNADKFLNS